MDRTWAPAIVVDRALAKVLIEDQFPHLCPLVVEALDPGWDNTVFRINERFVFRFPRREIAVPLIETELRCLPVLGPLLPVPIPIPVFAGQPSACYPWPFAGYTYIPGSCAARGTEDLAWRSELAVTLAEFLKALHTISPTDLPAAALPFDLLGRLDVRKRRRITESRLASLLAAGVISDARPILKILDDSPERLPSGPLVVTHGDLHAGQLLLTEHDALAGVIDWGDLHLGHAAVDLAAVHQLLPVRLHETFLATYGRVNTDLWQLAKARAAWHAVALIASAVDTGNTRRANEAKLAVTFMTEE